jgi:N6-adenosine-specific RNA methylase IME4
LPKLSDLGINKTQSSRWQALARIPDDRFERNIEHASKTAYDQMTRRSVKESEIERAQRHHQKLVEQDCTVDDLVALAAGGHRFPVIYADPPWKLRDWDANRPDAHFNCMELADIAALPVPALAAKDCALFLWIVNAELPGALETIKKWGLEYKTVAFVWIKQNKSGEGLRMGTGFSTRMNAELCLLATQGAPTRLAMDVNQVVMAPIAGHSVKPDEVRRRIERLYRGPYLELFARRPADGWAVWGNEIKRADFPPYDAADDIAAPAASDKPAAPKRCQVCGATAVELFGYRIKGGMEWFCGKHRKAHYADARQTPEVSK